MPGKPARRAREMRQIAGLTNGAVVPDLDQRAARAGLQPGEWRTLAPVEKLQTLYGLSLDAALIDVAYRGQDPTALHLRAAARHDILMICTKYALELNRDKDRYKKLDDLVKNFTENT